MGNKPNKQKKPKLSKKSNLPNFKKHQRITNLKTVSNYILFYEIYNLKNITKYFYILICFEIYPKGKNNISKYELSIYKYFYENNQFKNIKKIELLNEYFNAAKYFYNPLNNKEYLVFLKFNDSYELYLIEKETEFSLIKQDKDNAYENKINSLAQDEYEISYTDFFEIIYNKYEKQLYLISCVVILYDKNHCSKVINVRLFKDNKFYLIKSISFKIDYRSDISFCINEDKHLGKFYLFHTNKDGIKYFEIKEKYESNKIENSVILNQSNLQKLKDFFKVHLNTVNVFTNIFQNGNNSKYLYLIGISGLIIIDLCDKKIIKNIELKIKFLDIFVWNKYLLFIQNKVITIFDIRTNEIMSKYKINFEEEHLIKIKPNLIKKWFSKENNFYGLFFIKKNLSLLTC